MSRLLWMLALTGCSGASYVLELSPLLPTNQPDLLTDGMVIRLSVDGEEVSASTLTDGVVEIGDVGVLAGSWISVSAEEDTTEGAAFDPAKLVAYGEIGPLDLEREGKPVSRSVLFAATGGVAALGSLPRAALQGAPAITGDGKVFVFGGTAAAEEDAKDAIMASSSIDDGEVAFENVGSLPEPVFGARANVVDVDGRELIVVTGGQLEYTELGPNGAVVVVFDPATNEVVSTGETEYFHAQHLALTMPNQRVLLVGADIRYTEADGYTVGGSDAVAELFNPATNRSKDVGSTLPIGTWHQGGSVLVDGRALLCGGSVLNDTGDGSFPVDGCVFVDGAGEPSELAAPTLPEALHMHAMATLQDGRVLVTGGARIEVAFSASASAPALATAWLWDPQTGEWTEVDDMGVPRLKHRMVVLNDGTVLVVGGASEGGLLSTNVPDAIPCPEFFDPETLTFRTSNLCHGSGTGADIGLSFHPDAGVFLLEGMRDNGEGGKRVGYIPARRR